VCGIISGNTVCSANSTPWLDALSFVNSSHFMKLYYFMKCSIIVTTVKDVSFTLATKHSPDFRTVHLAVCPSSAHSGGWIQDG